MSGRDPPTFAGSILGLRAWTIHARLPSSATRLGAQSADATWEPGGAWTKARCKPIGADPKRHRAPQARCSCGLYALHPDHDTAQELWGESLHSDLHGVWGIVEAAGRIEVHRSGFRAERARPLALVAAADWPRQTREGVEELAALYGARVLSPARASDVVEWCNEHGGVLDPPQLDRLLEREERAPPPAPAPRAVPPPAPPAPRWKRAASTIGNALAMVVVGAFMVGWYGMWLAMGVMMVGGIFFGWLDEEVVPPPAKVVEVRVDRERCEVSATVESDRRFKQVNFRVDGHLRNGDPLGTRNFKVGPVAQGRSQLVIARPDPTLCRSRHHFTVRVQPRWDDVVGKRVEGRSRFVGQAEQPAKERGAAASTRQARSR